MACRVDEAAGVSRAGVAAGQDEVVARAGGLAAMGAPQPSESRGVCRGSGGEPGRFGGIGGVWPWEPDGGRDVPAGGRGGLELVAASGEDWAVAVYLAGRRR